MKANPETWRRKAGRVFSAAVAAVLFAGAVRVASGAYVPRDDSEVLEKLPESLVRSRVWREARQEMNSNPANRAAALALARSYLEAAQRTSDARYVSFARGVLGPFLAQREPAREVIYLRAVIRQHEHDFAGALSDLDSVLTKEPGNAAALVSKASILTTLGRYDEAKRIFRANFFLTRDLNALAVFCTLTSLSGGLEQSYALLARQVQDGRALDCRTRSFVFTALGELAFRMGRATEAESWLEQALHIEPDSSYALALWADLLLAADRADEVKRRLEVNPASEALLLRRLLAEAKSGSFNVRGRAMAAAETFRQSGHLRELAILELHCLHQPDAALRHALCNWEIQREPLDAAAVLEAATASGNPQAAEEVLAWLDENRLQDARLEQLKNELRVYSAGARFTQSGRK